MGLDAKKVFAPTPLQSATTGAVAVAPVGTVMPSDARSALSAQWDDSGYVSEDGLSVTVTRTTTPIKDWSKANVRNLLTDFGGAISLAFLQIDQFAANRMFGASNVEVTAANSEHGEIIKINIGAELPPIESWCFSMKDGNARVRVVVPRGQMTDVNQVDFKPDAGNVIGGTLAAYDDGTGHSIYFIYDDGEVISDGTSYTITSASTTHGSFMVSAASATVNTPITIIATPASDYEVDTVTYTPAGGTAIDARPGVGVYTFTMPAANVTVTVTFKSEG